MLTAVLQDAFVGESEQRAYGLCQVLQLRVNQQASQHFNVIKGKLIKIFGKENRSPSNTSKAGITGAGKDWSSRWASRWGGLLTRPELLRRDTHFLKVWGA